MSKKKSAPPAEPKQCKACTKSVCKLSKQYCFEHYKKAKTYMRAYMAKYRKKKAAAKSKKTSTAK